MKCNCIKQDVCEMHFGIQLAFLKIIKIRFGGSANLSDLEKLVRARCEFRIPEVDVKQP